MSQKLILPIKDCKLTASWKTDAYRKRYGTVHYGADLVARTGVMDGRRAVRASGGGTVVAVGTDKVVGKVIAVVYPGAWNALTGESADVVFRYFHMNSIAVKAGQTVTEGALLGEYGNTGMLKMSKHLHLEADLDTQYPLYTPTVSQSDLLRGTAQGATADTVVNPIEWLHCKASKTECQYYSTDKGAFIRGADKSVAVL